MYRHVLAPATGTAGDGAVFATALLVARAFSAHLVFLHAKMDVTEMIVAMTAGGGVGTAQNVIDQIEADAKAQEQRARDAFTRFADSAPDIKADMAVETGNEGQWLTEYGRFTDLVVAGRTRDTEDVAMDVLQALVIDSGTPVLLAPAAPPATLAETVVIAWKDTPQAIRAVASAMPFIERARRVVIVSAIGDGEADDASALRLRNWLRWHNGSTAVQTVPLTDRSAVEVLLAAAHNAGADLLVMGGYSHSQWREAVFGGVTQQVLRGADLPVLMAH
jgi:nucleotide-binding universal stress UspA family protein